MMYETAVANHDTELRSAQGNTIKVIIIRHYVPLNTTTWTLMISRTHVHINHLIESKLDPR